MPRTGWLALPLLLAATAGVAAVPPSPVESCGIASAVLLPGQELVCAFSCAEPSFFVHADGENVVVRGDCGGSSASCDTNIGIQRGFPFLAECDAFSPSGAGAGTCKVRGDALQGPSFVWAATCG